jgi:hypothetical protein
VITLPKYVDLAFSSDGDFVLDSNGNLQFAIDAEYIKEQIVIRCRTTILDWEAFPTIGASLGDLKGKMNTPDLVEYGKRRILNALIFDNFLDSEEIEIFGLPVNDKIIYHIEVTVDDEEISLGLLYDSNGEVGVL